MPSSSSSSVASNSQYCPRWEYDVFISFRGEDTRETVTGYLYERLTRRGIITFQDNKRLDHGDSIPEELLKAIEESQVALVIFSKNYATSRWCLDELVKIMDCKKHKHGQTVLPVFYDVDATEVRNQRGSFAEAFAKHELKYKGDGDEGVKKVLRWRIALTAAANLKGYVFPNGIESECVERIVDDISSKCKTSVSYLHEVVGIDTQLKKVESLLEIEIDDVRIVWLWGMGGVGKTTIAKAIFYKLSSKFKDVCFLENIKENKHGMHSLQNILISKLFGEKENCVKDKEEGRSMLARRLPSKKVLVVLDDIDHRDQLVYLAKDLGWFGKGSRIIATTRDMQFIGKDIVHRVETLSDHSAVKLFNQYAFREEVPDQCFKDLTLEIVRHAKGHPLALKVWGSLLHGKDIIVWRSALDRIKKNSGSEIIENLKISYDGLEPEEQEIFLDIACFFRGKEKKEVMPILESCGFPAEYGLSVLIDKCLVSISKRNRIEMHDLIQDMGQYIVNLHKDPGDRSRLWNVEDVKEVMVDNTETMAVEAIWCTYIEKLFFSKQAMKNMKRLRILYIRDSVHDHDGYIEYLPNNLRWFVWRAYPWKSLPENFEPHKLVHLDLRWSSLYALWTKRKELLPSLRKLDLSYSKTLMRTPDFTGIPNLEYLDLHGCSNLEEVHHSLGCCRKLILLDLRDCESLKLFPYVNVESLGSLNLRFCSSLEKFPEVLGTMKSELEIKVERSGIRELPSSIQYLTHITKLNLSDTKNLLALPSSICKLKGLAKLDVSWCSKLESLPEEIGDLENLVKLDARRTLISRPPPSIVWLHKLKFLSFGKQKSEDGVFFVFPQVNGGLCSLEILDLSYCNLIDGGLPEDIGCLSSLKQLYLKGNNFEHLPRSVAQLDSLEYLDTSHCKRLKELPDFTGMPNLETLNLSYCMNLEEVDRSLGYLNKLLRLELTNCKRLKRFPALCIDSLKYLDLEECSTLKNFPEILGSMKVKSDIHLLDSVMRDLNSMYISFPRSLSQYFFPLQHGLSASDSLSQRVFTVLHGGNKIPSWFHHQPADKSVSVSLPENWYVCDNFLGFALCFSGSLIYETTVTLILLCDDGMSWMTQKLMLLFSLSRWGTGPMIHFFVLPLSSLWDTSKANGKTPNDYRRIVLSFSEFMGELGFRLLYKDELELEASLQMRENKDEPTEHCIGTSSEHHDAMTNEASCSSS